MAFNALRCRVLRGGNVQQINEFSNFLLKKMAMSESCIRNFAKVMIFPYILLSLKRINLMSESLNQSVLENIESFQHTF